MYTQNNNSADITLSGMYYRSVRGPYCPSHLAPQQPSQRAHDCKTPHARDTTLHQIFILFFFFAFQYYAF